MDLTLATNWSAPLAWRPLLSSSAPPTANKQLSPIPAGLGIQEAETADRSIRYAGPSPVAARLRQADVGLIGVRHGETEANAIARQGGIPVVCGQSETPLTPHGREQARQAALEIMKRLDGEIPVIYSSPYQRAHETAQALADLLGVPIQTDTRLAELHFGELEMKRVTDVPRDLAHTWDSHRGTGANFRERFPGGESRIDVVERVTDFMLDMAQRHPGRKVVMFCHQETLVAARTALHTARSRDGKVRSDSQEIKNAIPITLA